MRRVLTTALAATVAVFAASAQAEETVIWWDFLGGGDGVRMKALLEQFNEAHEGEIEIQATTLEWGIPYYTKVQTSAAVGEGPDMMTYHLSRFPLAVPTGVLREITLDELASVGLEASDFNASNFAAAQVDGKLYGVPFDVHAVVLYYNKDLLRQAGLLGDDGLPTGLDGVDNFNAALAKLEAETGVEYALSIHSDEGSSLWRIFYSLFGQEGGLVVDDGQVLPGDNLDKAVAAASEMAKWVKEGWSPKLTAYPASIALFTSGEAAMHINGVWEVPTMVDLAKNGELFDWGAIRLPVLYDQPATWADSHAFAIPNNADKPVTPEKLDAVLKVIAWMNENSLFWATAGHIPAYVPVTDSDEYKTMQPNAVYSVLAETAVFDPRSEIAGVASPLFDAATNYLVPAVNDDMDPQEAMELLRDELQSMLE
ncbi:extracellular solute-binding protein [Bauldia sp.]|uniref:extracellular solute-binding protein n=1 Tax=Bauldia sp. TaxID=2575872 RepID=UPI003BA8DD9C